MNRFRFVMIVLVVLAIGHVAHTTTTQRWVIDTAQELLEGRGDNVEVTSEGLLRVVAGWSAGDAAARGDAWRAAVDAVTANCRTTASGSSSMGRSGTS